MPPFTKLIAAAALVPALLVISPSLSLADGRVLMVVTSHDRIGGTDEATGLWLSEVTHPYYEFVDNSYDVDFVSPKGGQPPIDPRSIEAVDSVNVRFRTDSVAQARFLHTAIPDAVNPADYDIIFFAGGHGTMWDFPDNARLARLAAAIYENAGYVGAVCHGPAALINVILSDDSYLVDGKKVTGFTNEEEQARGLDTIVPFLLQDKLTGRGADFVAGEKWSENIVISGRLVTGQNPASAKGVADSIIAERAASPVRK